MSITGTVKKWDSAKGWGFIKRIDGKGDVFVHYTGISGPEGRKQLIEGQQVEFDVVEGEKGLKAANVAPI